MLDYAANGVVYWPVDAIRTQFETNCTMNGINPEQMLIEFLGPDIEIDQFWAKVKTNLQVGRIRMIFVADLIPPELKRIVEFLNEQMEPAEVLAIEIKQFVGEGLRTLVPIVVGQTSEAQQKKKISAKSIGNRKAWDENSFMDAVASALDQVYIASIKKLLEFCKNSASEVSWGTGSNKGSFSPKFSSISARSLFTVYTDGNMILNFGWLNDNENAEMKRDEFKGILDNINEFKNIIPEDQYKEKYVRIPLEIWSKNVEKFINAVERLL